MILADKILALRKNMGWSQEELAEKMNVSRQSVSKWESAAAIPDIGKILELAGLFGVTTDYLLKDDIEKAAYTDRDECDTLTHVSLQEANAFMERKTKYGKSVGLGVFLCVLSPAVLLLLQAISEAGKASEEIANGVGITVLLCMIAAAVTIFIVSGEKMKQYKYLLKGDFKLDYGVAGIVNEKRVAYANTYTWGMASGVVLCILSVIPLIITGIYGASDATSAYMTALMLAIIAAGIYILIAASSKKQSYDQLLLEGEFDPEEKKKDRKSSKFSRVYWPIVTAIYLGWSFATNNWGISWMVWPVAALVFAGVSVIFKNEE